MTISGIIESIIFTVDKNRNLFAKLKLMDNETIFTIYNGIHYGQTKLVGDKINIVQKRENFADIVVPKQFDELWNKEIPFVKAVRKSFENFRKSLIAQKFEEAIDIAEFEEKNIIDDFVQNECRIIDNVVESLKNSDSEYAKTIVREMDIKKSAQTINPYDELSRLANKVQVKDLKGYKTVVGGV